MKSTTIYSKFGLDLKPTVKEKFAFYSIMALAFIAGVAITASYYFWGTGTASGENIPWL